jgi:hypothetical protein
MTFEVPDEWTANDVREWLLRVTSGGQSEFFMPPQIALPVVFKSVFQSCPPERRERLKYGAVMALQEWQYGAHGYASLKELARVSAAVRASAAISRLAEIIRVECAINRHRDPDRLEALDAATASLTGFAPAQDLDGHLRVLYYDRAIEPQLGALLFIGLCKGMPSTMAVHVDRFIELRELVPSGFAHIGWALLDAVPPVLMIGEFRKLRVEARAILAKLLEAVRHPDLIFSFDDSGVQLHWRGEPAVRTTVYAGAPERLSDWFAGSIGTVPGGDLNAALLRMARQSIMPRERI